MLDFVSLIAVYGYAGVFVVSIISTASVFLPVPSFLVLIGAVKFLDPVLLIIVFSVGSAIGELVSYGIGFGGRNIAFIKKTKKKWKKHFDMAERWFEKHGGFVVVVLFAATPLPHDIVGLLCGIIRYDVKRFFVATLIGKTIQTAAIVYIAFYGIDIIAGII